MPIYQMSIFRMPKMVARRLEKVQRDFLWGRGNMEGKTHLVNWEVVCTDKAKGGLGIRKLALLNKALLGKWIWRRILGGGQRRLWGGGSRGLEGDLERIRNETALSHCFPHFFAMAVQRNSTVEEMWDQNSGHGNWNLNFLRDFNDWELGLVGDFLQILRGHKPSGEEDSVLWRKGRRGQFRVKEAYNLLARSGDTAFPQEAFG
ncbi:putative ribonuclease H protein [Vitis vinifera]|uniref:Putative ribonuclease H protein n=1 Tax=Vitis vinifera TaxID=29760 RepID=A0A438I568_VITVI|nr:putative ribonuclease H protein [Vitis vinifera]